jgi:lysophospholipase L1-like esterase
MRAFSEGHPTLTTAFLSLWGLGAAGAYFLAHYQGWYEDRPARDIGFALALGLWLVVLMRLPRLSKRYVWPRMTLIALSLGASLFIAEAGLRHFEPFYVVAPNLRYTFDINPEILPGLHGPNRYSTDALGIRGTTPYADIPDGAYRVLAVGASTTEEYFIDDRETWTHLTEAHAQAAGYPLWLGNLGKSAHNTHHHYLTLRYFVSALDVDMVLMLVGINDAVLSLTSPENNRSDILKGQQDPAFRWTYAVYNFHTLPWRVAHRPHTYALMETIIAASKRLSPKAETRLPSKLAAYIVDSSANFYQQRRQEWQAAPVTLTSLPANFEADLAIYRRNLHLLADEAQAQGWRLVFMTQPTIHRPDLPASFQAYLWMGYAYNLGPARYAPGTMADIMAAYNGVVLEVCAERGLACIDLAAEVPKETRYFYDDVHFTELGSQKVAEAVWENLRPLLPAND